MLRLKNSDKDGPAYSELLVEAFFEKPSLSFRIQRPGECVLNREQVAVLRENLTKWLDSNTELDSTTLIDGSIL